MRLRKGFCEQCFTRRGCGLEPCTLVLAELRSKGVYDMDPNTGALMHKGKEISLVFLYDPYTDSMQGLKEDDDGD